MPTAPVDLQLLGAIDVRGLPHDDAHSLLAQPKLVALLAHLAIAGDGAPWKRRDTIVGLLWPELDQAHARTALRKAVHGLRAVLGPDAIVGRGDEEIALAADCVACDLVLFLDDIENGRLAEALERYRGDLMPGFHLTGCDEFERWLEGERTEARERAAAASWALATLFESDRSLTNAAKWARRAARFAWDDERTLRRALLLLDRCGDRAGALRLYEDFRERLARELEGEPSQETQQLAQKLRPAR